MTKKITKFDTVINNNPIAMTLYNEQKTLLKEVNDIRKQIEEKFSVYSKMEGKYAIEMITDGAEMGYRGYYFKYPSKETKAKEEKERENYYIANIQPLKDRTQELRTKISEIDEQICFAIFGYSKEHRRLLHNLEIAKKEFQECLEHLEELKEEIENLQKEIEKNA
jgi:archaellum component FlaC